MTDEELEETGLFSVIRDIEDLDIGEQLEEIEDRLDYLDITKAKRRELEELINDIRLEFDQKEKEKLFNELINKLDN